MHCPVKTIDHIGELLSVLGKGSTLKNVRLHQTKCSKLISAVISPAFLTELVRDVGGSPFSIIADESTDVAVSKFMGLCIRYFSKAKNGLITDFLGLVQVTSCTGEILATALKEYLNAVGLPLQQLQSIGTDGASNMCGVHNSFYTHLKKDVSHLQLFKCICHSIDKSAQHAFKTMPDHLTYLLQESSGWFSHNSAKRWAQYVEFFQERHGSKPPKKVKKLCLTRWPVWLPVSSEIVDQWCDLRDFFVMKSNAPDADHRSNELAKLMSDNANLLRLTFLKWILQQVHEVNVAFELNNVDITKLFTDLHNLVFSLSARVLKPAAMAETIRPSVLRSDEVSMLKAAFLNQDNCIPLDRINFGISFKNILPTLNLSNDDMATVRRNCANYILCLWKQLLDRLPSNVAVIGRLRHFSPRIALGRLGRPSFDQLPIELGGPRSDFDADRLESQWIALGAVNLAAICQHVEFNQDIAKIDIVHFWSCVLNCTDAGCKKPFDQLALFVLKTVRALTLPISNAVVQRVFSFMSAIKTNIRSSMQLDMLDALLRLRVHRKVNGQCCKQFQPTKDMLANFNSSMYASHHEQQPTPDDPDADLEEQLGVPGPSPNSDEDLHEEDYQNLLPVFETPDSLALCNRM